jgi:hypothetical protein
MSLIVAVVFEAHYASASNWAPYLRLLPEDFPGRSRHHHYDHVTIPSAFALRFLVGRD